MTPSEALQIKSWLESKRNYAEGLALLVKHTNNPSISRIYHGREHRYAGKLAYEISKLVTGLNRYTKPVKPDKPVKLAPLTKPIPDGTAIEEVMVSNPDMPKIIVRIIAQFSDLYKCRSIAHAALKKVAPDCRSESNEYRRILVEKIGEYSDRMDELHHYHNEYNTLNIIPEEAVVFPPKKVLDPIIQPDNLESLIHARKLLVKSLNRDTNMAEYQTITKQPVKNPMPAGPKRTALLTRIKLRQTEITNLNARIEVIKSSQLT